MVWRPRISGIRNVRRCVQVLVDLSRYDFCPWANRYVYWLKQPIGWLLVAALASVLIGLFVAVQGWVVSAVIGVVMVLGVIWPWIALLGVDAEAVFDRERCHEQEVVGVRLMLVNRWPFPVWGLLLEGLLSGEDAVEVPAVAALARVSGWSRTEFWFPFCPPRRGRYPRATPCLTTGFPFGLWTAVRPVRLERTLLVWPRLIELKSMPLVQGQSWASAGTYRDRAGHDGDFLSARAYRTGDSLRRVHWVMTARRDMLMVSERQSIAGHHLLLRLDDEAFADDGPQRQERLEWALRLLASMGRNLHGHACQLACELHGERNAIPSSTQGLRAFLDRLATYEPSAEPPHASRSRAGVAATSIVVCVTTDVAWTRIAGHARSASAGRVRGVVLASSMDSEDALFTAVADSCHAPWMRLDLAGDVVRQLQNQWEQRCHVDWSLQ